jgi:LmbE family N-acetylglucosaminyl deacetylase
MLEFHPNPRPERVLVVAAHPDDIEFLAGGTLGQWARAGVALHYLLVTDGAGGSRDPEQTQRQLAAIRRAEQRHAAQIVGVRSVTFLGYDDGRVEHTLELRIEIARVMRRVRPDVVVTQDPMFRYSSTYVNHPDHRAVAEATLAAIMPLANTRLSALELLDEGLEPHDVSEIYLSAPTAPSVWSSLTADDLDFKLQALRAHLSQLKGWNAEQMACEWAMQVAAAARELGINCEFAEAFDYIRLAPPSAATSANPPARSTSLHYRRAAPWEPWHR